LYGAPSADISPELDGLKEGEDILIGRIGFEIGISG
jgi:hypothetical protein